MRQGDISIELVLESGGVLPEVTNGGVTYAVASPGEQFSVRVSSHRADINQMVELKVDGVTTGYNYTLTPVHRHCTFQGILVNAAGEDAQHKLFQFNDASPDDPSSAAAAQPGALESIKMGRIQVYVTRVVDSGTTREPSYHRANEHHAGPAGVKLPDGKKWFLAPSLSASNGPVASKKMNWTSTVWTRVSEPVEYTMRYETAAILQLRGLLDEDVPAHRELLQQSLQEQAARVAAAVVKPEPGGNGAGASGSRAQKKAAKRKQGAGASRSNPGPPPMVDLSIEKDDNVLCDLTGDAPAWHWSKKPKIEIDL